MEKRFINIIQKTKIFFFKYLKCLKNMNSISGIVNKNKKSSEIKKNKQMILENSICQIRAIPEKFHQLKGKD